jgi:hypothetical protein
MLYTVSVSLQLPAEHQWIPHKPSHKQALFLSLSCREALYGGSAGCGKSDALLMAAAQGIEIPGYRAILFRRTYKDLIKPDALMDRARRWWSKTPARWSHEEMCWHFPSGATIGFGYMDCVGDLENYQGGAYQFVGWDEQTHFPGDWITYMFSRIRRTESFPKNFPLRMRGATNPGSIGHDFTVERYGIRTDAPFPPGSPPVVHRNALGMVDRVFLPAHAEDNPGLDWSDYERSLEQLTPIKRKQLKEGWWIQDSSGLVYPNAGSALFVDSLPPGEDWSYVLAFDIGASNNCAFAIYAVSKYRPEIYLLSTSEPEGLNTPRDLALHIRGLDSVYHFASIVGDYGGLGKGYLEEFRKYFAIPVEYAEKQNKRGYIELFDGAIANGMVRIVKSGCATWIDESGKLLWKNGQRLEEMPGMRNHSCDASLYGWRKASHYSHEERPIEKRLDAQEQLEAIAFTTEQDSLDRYGVVLPDCLM